MGTAVILPDELDYGVDTIGFIYQALSGYVGLTAIVSEMVQNADDAEASLISLHFRSDQLIVRNNSSFKEQDFKRISRISSGFKRDEEGKIGNWGTGFLSVYHITDSPELLSSGCHIIFDPTKSKLRPRKTSFDSGTEFRFPWRRHETAISKRLQAHVWNDEDICTLKEELAATVYKLVIHLRHVTTIEVYEGDAEEKLLYRVHRAPKQIDQLSGFQFEQWEIEYKRIGVAPRVDTWLYYRTEIPREQKVEGVTVKDFQIAMAFPLEEREWLKQNVRGAVYNFLRTPIETGFAIQINGAFFPDSNRRGILIDDATQREKSLWNRRVIEAIAHLFTSALIHIRDQVKDPERFYNLLPLEPATFDRAFLAPIHETFVQLGKELPIVFTTLGQWYNPQEVYLVQPQAAKQRDLGELAAGYMPLLPQSAPQSVRQFLRSKLDCTDLKWQDVVVLLSEHLVEGVKLLESHPMIASRKKLSLLYSALPHNFDAEGRQLLSTVPLCLLEDGTLCPFDEANCRADKETRDLLRQLNFLFVDITMQEQFGKLFETLVDEFRGVDLISWFNNQDWPESPFPLKEIRQQIRNPKHLADMLRFISADIDNLKGEDLAQAPLVLTGRTLVARSIDTIFLHDDADERSRLGQLGIEFVNPEFATDTKIRAIYERARVKSLSAHDVVQAIKLYSGDWSTLSRKEIIARLTTLYWYLGQHRHHLTEEDKQTLRGMPLCLTQQGRLVESRQLYRPRSTFLNERVQSHINKLQLDNLIADELLSNEDCVAFIIHVLEIEAISPAALIGNFIIPNGFVA